MEQRDTGRSAQVDCRHPDDALGDHRGAQLVRPVGGELCRLEPTAQVDDVGLSVHRAQREEEGRHGLDRLARRLGPVRQLHLAAPS